MNKDGIQAQALKLEARFGIERGTFTIPTVTHSIIYYPQPPTFIALLRSLPPQLEC